MRRKWKRNSTGKRKEECKENKDENKTQIKEWGKKKRRKLGKAIERFTSKGEKKRRGQKKNGRKKKEKIGRGSIDRHIKERESKENRKVKR